MPSTNKPAADEVRQLLVHPVVWQPLTSWLAARGIALSQQQFSDDDLPTYVMTPDRERPATSRDRLAAYTRIFKQLPREAATELIAALTTDPDLTGRRTVIAQAALLVSFGHAMDWTDNPA